MELRAARTTVPERLASSMLWYLAEREQVSIAAIGYEPEQITLTAIAMAGEIVQRECPEAVLVVSERHEEKRRLQNREGQWSVETVVSYDVRVEGDEWFDRRKEAKDRARHERARGGAPDARPRAVPGQRRGA